MSPREWSSDRKQLSFARKRGKRGIRDETAPCPCFLPGSPVRMLQRSNIALLNNFYLPMSLPIVSRLPIQEKLSPAVRRGRCLGTVCTLCIDDFDVMDVRARGSGETPSHAQSFNGKRGEEAPRGPVAQSFAKERRQEDARATRARYHRPRFTHIESASASAFPAHVCARMCGLSPARGFEIM